jgi:hypothetical protein
MYNLPIVDLDCRLDQVWCIPEKARPPFNWEFSLLTLYAIKAFLGALFLWNHHVFLHLY